MLDITDKRIIEHGDELTDKHIQMAQNQFPLLGGLQNTLKQLQLCDDLYNCLHFIIIDTDVMTLNRVTVM